MDERPFAMVPKEKANSILHRFFKLDLVDKRHQIRKKGDKILIPLKDGSIPPGFEIGTDLFRKRVAQESPQDALMDFREKKPDVFIPRRWIRLGDAIIIKNAEDRIPDRDALSLLARKLRAKAVYIDTANTMGTERKPDLRIIYGTNHPVEHRENGVRYLLDPLKVMFSPGNVNARGIMRNMNFEGKTVLDMFAGIGYFSIPCAKYSGSKVVYCSEINRDSYEYLIRNVQINRIGGIIRAANSDCRNAWAEVKADVIVMGHFSSPDFLSAALLRSHEGTTIIMHILAPTGKINKETEKIIRKAQEMGYIVHLTGSNRVKSYSPHNWHWQITFSVSRVN